MGNAGKKGTHSTKVKFAACPGCGPGRDDKIATRYKRGKKENAPHNVRCAIWERRLALGWAAKGARGKRWGQGKRKSFSWNADAF